MLYPCRCSRKELALAASAPNGADDEPLYPGKCSHRKDASTFDYPAGVNWRFRVPEREAVRFVDRHLGEQDFVAGQDFGDFVVWRRDDVPAYQLAVVVDDAEMEITEVVRGADLLKSTARQILVYRALGFSIPEFYHCNLVRDEAGERLAKRNDALSIRQLREAGWKPEQVLAAAIPGN
jgi:glutamyl/glutaminyl-tRNA synthetase